MSCTLYYPGLLGPAVPLEALPAQDWPATEQLPCLTRLFSVSQLQALDKTSIEARILHGVGLAFESETALPVAKLRAQRCGLQTEAMWCLDPVHVQIDQDEAVLVANEGIELSAHEAQHLIEDLNQHLAQDGLRIHYYQPHQWLLEGDFALTTQSIYDVMQQRLQSYQPQGQDASRWQALLNELQMLLYTHSVNEQRELRQEPTVNSLWLWGGGRDYQYEKIVDVVYSNDHFVQEISDACDIRYQVLPEKLDASLLASAPDQTHLMVLTEQMTAIKQNDVFAWFDYLSDFENRFIAPLFDMLKQDRLDHLTIYSDTISLQLTKKRLTSWWRRNKAFPARILQLRTDYGY